MLETSARLLRLLSLLQARPTWSGAELIDRLEVTDRTLRRDVDRLRNLGYPVHSTSGPAGGYMLGPGAALPPLMLDDDEGLAVALGLESAAAGSIPELGEASQRALAKLEQVMPPRLRKRLAGVRSTILRLPDRGPRVPLAHLDELAAACASHRTASFRYRDHAGASSERNVEPHRLVLMGRRWYLVAWDRDRADWRTFRVDRIEPPVTRGAPFTPRAEPDGDLAGFVTRAVTSAPYRHRARVILHAPIEAMRERLRPSYGQLEPVSARRCRLITGAPSLDAIAMWLVMLDVPFRVESPPELRDHLRALSERLAAGARR
ncbi:MAG TPA: YafY family protein [Kofleriaceae bacterium]|nr:YafY family protein [Kofleriaceae bacterium]